MKKFIFAFICTILGIASCSKPDDPKDEPLTPDEITFDAAISSAEQIPAEGGDLSIQVRTNGTWKHELSSGADSWITAEARTASLILTVSANGAEEERTAKVTIHSVEKSGVSKTFSIVQKAGAHEDEKEEEALAADLLDVVFNPDGTATDVSPLKNKVQYYPGTGASYYYNEAYDRVFPSFDQKPGSSTKSGYYRIDYYNNEKFRKGLEDGHSLETVIRVDEDDNTQEIKPFSAHDGGGTGFLIRKNDGTITFLPNVPASKGGDSRWIWCDSKTVLEHGRYYHLVGVWDKEAGKARVYIDGELKGEVDAAGHFRHAKDGARWFGIGGDASGSGAQNAWNGEVGIARVYDKVLTDDDVKHLYQKVENKTQTPVDFNLSSVIFLGDAEVAAGYTYTIYGKGFESGDILRFTSVADSSQKLETEITLGEASELQSASIVIPAGLQEGRHTYSMTLHRQGSHKSLGIVSFTITSNPKIDDVNIKVIAHRGHHKESSSESENSLGALKSAQKLGIYGAEFDVWVTKDDKVVLYHDSKLGSGQKIEECTYDQIKDYKLDNGEVLPTFEAYLEQGKLNPEMKLVCEIKTHSNATNNKRAVEAVAAAVKAKKMESQVDYIAFDYEICKQLVAAFPSAKVMFLSSDTNTPPSKVAADKISAIDYSYGVLSEKLEWVNEAHELGLEVNAWTVNSDPDIRGCIWMGVDYITTDYPAKVKELLDNLQFVKAN